MSGKIDIRAENDCIGNWVKKKSLGRGGFGVVSLWENEKEHKNIAIKACRRDTGHLISKKQRERWCNEVEILKKLSHPNLVTALPVPEDFKSLNLDLPLLCMEYCHLGDLRQQLIKPENCCGLLEEDIRHILSDVKEAIQYLHSFKIIHRDLKPENIVLQQEMRIVYKLIDLGYAKEVDQNSLCSSVVGTLQYLAPELFTQIYTCSVDYWSFGLVCHEIITGFRPFIPHSLPLKWMEIVKKKSFDDICIYECLDESIVYSQEMFAENHISQPFRYEIEKWLRLALEWDGRKRGKTLDNRLILFSNLDSILRKKIVSVYSTEAFNTLCYEVDESTLVGTLKQWIQRDIKHPVDQQVIMLPSGNRLEDSALVHLYWNPDNQVAMLYVFPMEGLSLPKESPKVPMLVWKMLGSPKEMFPFHILKHTFANAVFYVQRILEAYTLFLEAYAVKMLSILADNQLITTLEQESNRELYKVFSKYKLFKDSLQYDLKRLKDVQLNNSEKGLSEKWNASMKEMDLKVANLSEVSKRLTSAIGVALKKVASLQNYEDPGQIFLEELKKLLSVSQNIYSKFRSKSEEERQKKYDSNDMAQVIYLVIKVCGTMLKDEPLTEHLKEVQECEKSVFCLIHPLKSFKQHIIKFYGEVTNQQLQRQMDVWDLICNKRNVVSWNPSFRLHEHAESTHSLVLFGNLPPVERSNSGILNSNNAMIQSGVQAHPSSRQIAAHPNVPTLPENLIPNPHNELDQNEFLKNLQSFGLDIDGFL